MAKKLTKKYTIIVLFAIVAVAAIALGLCLFFLGNKPIKLAPQTVSVNKVDDKYYVTTDFNAEYEYQFKLEQYIDGNFLVVNTVNSKTNSICLSDNEINIVAGTLPSAQVSSLVSAEIFFNHSS